MTAVFLILSASIAFGDSSAFFIVETFCGNNICEPELEENTETCPLDCGPAPTPTPNATAAPTPNATPAATPAPTVTPAAPPPSSLSEQLTKLIEAFIILQNNTEPAVTQKAEELLSIPRDAIDIRISQGEQQTIGAEAINVAGRFLNIFASLRGEIAIFARLEKSSYPLQPNATAEIKLDVRVPTGTVPGIHRGELVVVAEHMKYTVPINLLIIEKAEPLLDLRVDVLTKAVKPGDIVRFKVTLFNLGKSKRIDAFMYYNIINQTSNYLSNSSESIAVETSVSYIRDIQLGDIKLGNYLLQVTAVYENKTAIASDTLAVVLEETLFGVPTESLLRYLLVVLLIGVVLGGALYLSSKAFSQLGKKLRVWLRYIARMFPAPNLSKLPKQGAFIGKVKNSEQKAYIDLDDLMQHCLIAGGTGSGKSISAMVIAEEALKRNVPVIAFDPTGQWTGFIKPCKDSGLLKQYKNFGMSALPSPFKTNIISVVSPDMDVDIGAYMKEPEITVLVLNKLTPSQLDQFMTNTLSKLFRMDLDQSSKLKLLVVAEEVHRFLPKYGGANAYRWLEKGVREFRKWGIGLVMISQVLSDFRGAIRGNIGTEMQLRTKYEGDISRIEKKYGALYGRLSVKLSTGTVLLQNSNYNEGKPYFVSIRPILHDTSKISSQELDQIQAFSEKLDAIEKRLAELKQVKKDVEGIELDLQIAREKLKQGYTYMAESYIKTMEAGIKKKEK